MLGIVATKGLRLEPSSARSPGAWRRAQREVSIYVNAARRNMIVQTADGQTRRRRTMTVRHRGGHEGMIGIRPDALGAGGRHVSVRPVD